MRQIDESAINHNNRCAIVTQSSLGAQHVSELDARWGIASQIRQKDALIPYA